MTDHVVSNPFDVPAKAERRALPAPALDPADYSEELAALALSPEQEAELLEILWSIMGFFARTGFEVDVCGLIFEDFNAVSTGESADGTLAQSTNMEMPSKGSTDGGAS